MGDRNADRTFSTQAMREIALTEPSPMAPHLMDTLRRSLVYASHLIDAQDEVIAEYEAKDTP